MGKRTVGAHAIVLMLLHRGRALYPVLRFLERVKTMRTNLKRRTTWLAVFLICGCTTEANIDQVQMVERQSSVEDVSGPLQSPLASMEQREAADIRTWAELKFMSEWIVAGTRNHMVFNEGHGQGGRFEVIVTHPASGEFRATVRNEDNTPLLEDELLLTSLRESRSSTQPPALVNVRVDDKRIAWLFIDERKFYVQVLSLDNGGWELLPAVQLQESEHSEILRFLVDTLTDPRRILPDGKRVIVPSVFKLFSKHRIPICVWAIENLGEVSVVNQCLSTMLNTCSQAEMLAYFEGKPILMKGGLAEELDRLRKRCADGRVKRDRRRQEHAP